MQNWKLRIPHLLDHAEREHGMREIVTCWADGQIERTSWAGVALDARRLARALVGLGCQPGDHVATLALNHHRHLVSWYAVIGLGGVIHTVNVRLADDDLVYIFNHAQDRVLLYDAEFAPIVERIRSRLTSIEHYVCFDHPAGYPALIASQDDGFEWHDGDERDPCMLCYTSGTTGRPKGVAYEHRSHVLQALTVVAPAVCDLAPTSSVMPVVPLFHASSWGLPFACAAAGAKLVLSASSDPAVLLDLMIAEGVTHSAAVPTIWLAFFQRLDELAARGTPASLDRLKLVLIGGSAAPRMMIERLAAMGVRPAHGWGMTETSPVGTICTPTAGWETMQTAEQIDRLLHQGRVPFGVELRVVDENGVSLPRDGQSAGDLQVRGPWVVRRYFREPQDAVGDDQWFDTGDVAVLHPDGMLQITDRKKDVIKSGGEWISSVELENLAVGCPGIALAAAIGVPHPRWAERPVLLVVPKPGATVDEAALRAHLARSIARWWMPDAIIVVDDLPRSGTGKIRKNILRETYNTILLQSGAGTAAGKGQESKT